MAGSMDQIYGVRYILSPIDSDHIGSGDHYFTDSFGEIIIEIINQIELFRKFLDFFCFTKRV